MVELRGIEPLSESTLTELSPGAVGYGAVLPPFPSPEQAHTLTGSGSFIMHGALKALRTHGRC